MAREKKGKERKRKERSERRRGRTGLVLIPLSGHFHEYEVEIKTPLHSNQKPGGLKSPAHEPSSKSTQGKTRRAIRLPTEKDNGIPKCYRILHRYMKGSAAELVA